jgi:hypothetical protein
MTTKPSGAARGHGKVMAEMLGLVLRGTVAAVAVAALAMGLIAFAAG